MAGKWQATGGNYTRSQRILFVVSDLVEVMRDLDKLQVGDIDNSISPIKHALAENAEKLRAVGRRESQREWEASNNGRNE